MDNGTVQACTAIMTPAGSRQEQGRSKLAWHTPDVTQQLLLVGDMTLRLIAHQRCDAVDHHHPAEQHEGLTGCAAPNNASHGLSGKDISMSRSQACAPDVIACCFPLFESLWTRECKHAHHIHFSCPHTTNCHYGRIISAASTPAASAADL